MFTFSNSRRPSHRTTARRPLVDILEGRNLLTTLGPVNPVPAIVGAHIGSVTVDAIQGQHIGTNVSVDTIQGQHIGIYVITDHIQGQHIG